MRRDASRVAYCSIAWLIIGVLAASCTSSRTVIGPPMAPATPVAPGADEVRLWSRAESEEEQIQRLVKAYDDPLLAAYLIWLGDKLVSGDARDPDRPGFTFVVLRDPTLSAFAMPNGRIYVHTGLLACLANEAQLAMILAHEMTHVTQRHALRVRHPAQDPQSPFGSVLSPTASVLLGRGLQLAVLAAMSGYGRELEREADTGGVARLVRAGYDPRVALKVFERLGTESTGRGSVETFFFGNRSHLAERVEDANELIRASYSAIVAAPDIRASSGVFAMRMRPVVRENARLDTQAGRFTLAAEQLDRVLALTANDPIAQLYYGDLYRLQSQRSSDVTDRADKETKARERYERAARLDPTYADPFRQLGFLYYQQKDNARAREAFEKYLSLNPGGPDAERVKEYLAEIAR